jgi:hypothetical protein
MGALVDQLQQLAVEGVDLVAQRSSSGLAGFLAHESLKFRSCWRNCTRISAKTLVKYLQIKRWQLIFLQG